MFPIHKDGENLEYYLMDLKIFLILDIAKMKTYFKKKLNNQIIKHSIRSFEDLSHHQLIIH